MRKRSIMEAIASVLTLSLAACSAATGPGTSNNNTNSSGTTVSGTSEGTVASSGDASNGELIKVGYISASWSDDYCKRLSDAIVELGPKYGLEVDAINASPQGQVDVSGYIEAIDSMKQKGIKGLMVQPLFTVPDMCVEFQNNGVPITFVNIQPQIDDDSKDLKYYYAGSYEESIGAQLAEAQSPGLKKNAKVCMIELMQGQDNQIGRDKGYVDWMKENRPDVQILETNYVLKNDVTEAVTIMEDWLSKYGKDGIDGVATQSNMQTQGIIESMKSHGLTGDDICVGGISAANSDWILEGNEYCDLYQNPYTEASTALNAMSKQIAGKTDEIEVKEGTDNYCNVEMTVMNKDNAEDYSSKNIAETAKKAPLVGLDS
jgi:ABC-type sugar transport system substrate-binding protein